MPAKVNKMSDTKKAFEKHLRQVHKQEAEEILEIFEKETKELLNRTIRGQTSPYGGFSDARPRIIKNVIVMPQGVLFKARIYMSDPSNQPHKIWHFINGGTSDRVVKKGKSFTIQFPRSNRTSRRSLDTGSFAGFKRGWHYFGEGAKVKGITARNFYKRVLGRLNQTYFKKNRIKAWGVREKDYNNG